MGFGAVADAPGAVEDGAWGELAKHGAKVGLSSHEVVAVGNAFSCRAALESRTLAG
jgi:hypothetical protein